MATRRKLKLRRRNKKIRGGVKTSSSTLGSLFTQLETNSSLSESDLTLGPMNLSDLDVTDSSDMNNTTLNTNDLSINNGNNLTPITPANTNELYISLDTDLSTSTNDKTTSEERSMSFGGRKTKKYNKRRKGRKTKKSRKNKRQKGGRGFTTSVTTSPIAYKEDEYDQFKNALNYKKML